MRILFLVLLQSLIGLSATSAFAGRDSFDPSAPCDEVILSGDVGDKTLVVFWASGYLAKTDGQPRVITADHLNGMFEALKAMCAQAPTAPLQQVVESFAVAQLPAPAPTAIVAAPSTASPAPTAPAPVITAKTEYVVPSPPARDVLLRFFEPDADRAALTAALKPTEAEIRAVYADPLASKLVANYNSMFTPGVEIGPKPEHVELYTVITTTGKLKSRAVAADAFPGGYRKVTPFFIANQPIVRFKFVKSGETTGLAYDGLIFVNGRWVLMPKPWRSLE